MDGLRCVLVARQWALLVNCSTEDAAANWPGLEHTWRKRQVESVYLRLNPADSYDNAETIANQTVTGKDWRLRMTGDELRPSRQSATVETANLVVGICASGAGDEPAAGARRALIIDASWTHIFAFPEREEVRTCLAAALHTGRGRVFYISDLDWDVALFRGTAHDLGAAERAVDVTVKGSREGKLVAARQVLRDVREGDTVLIGLVPGRDDRGAFQRLRSDFAERASVVRAFPGAPLSTGPGLSRDEALAAVGLWLPTEVLIAGGPISEQVLLARHLEESTSRSPVTVGVAGGEYRLPDFDLIRHSDTGRRHESGPPKRAVASRSGLVVVALTRDADAVSLAGTGLSDNARDVLPKLRINRRGKTPEQVVREVEMAFTSRGLPVPAVRFIR